MGMVFGRIAEELPRHSIVSKHATYQIRRYEPSIAVQCDYSRGWGNSSDGTPFGALARYIGVFSEPENVKRPRVSCRQTMQAAIERPARRQHDPTCLGDG